MSNFIDIRGQKFGRLMAIFPTSERYYGRVVWLTQCDCGEYYLVPTMSFVSGLTKSCGCFHRESSKQRASIRKLALKHGYTNTSIYTSWEGMKQRCLNPKNQRYEYYGGRGITICDRWSGKHGFENFLEDMGPKPEGLSIDRKDNDGNYEPGNCKWSTQKEQVNNSRRVQGAKNEWPI